MTVLNNGGLPTPLTCLFRDPPNVSIQNCSSLSSQIIQLVIGANLSYYIQFDVVNAVTNPPSTTFSDSLLFQTFRGNNLVSALDYQLSGVFIAATNDSLSTLQMISSLSQNAGDHNTIQFGLKMKNNVQPNGLVQVQFPYLFNVTQDNVALSMIDTNTLICIDLGSNTQITCTFQTRTQTLTLSTIIGTVGKPAGSVISFSINGVLNPISTDVKASIVVRTTDSIGGIVDQGAAILQAQYPNQIISSSITATSSLVQDITTYQIQFQIGVPIQSGGCSVEIYLPSKDFMLQQASITGVQGFGLFGALRSYTYTVNQFDNSIIISDACQNYVLPNIAATIYILGLRNPEVAKPTDPISINIWNSAGGRVAELTTANSPVFYITPGQATAMKVTTPVLSINSISDFTVYFQFQHYAVTTATSSSTLPAHIEITFSDYAFQISPYVSVTQTNVPGSQVSVESFNATLNKITVIVTVPQILSDAQYYIQFTNMKLAGAQHSMGPIVVTLSKQWFTGSSYIYYPIDNGTSSSQLLTTTPGQLISASIIPASIVVYDLTAYSFQVLIENDIPQGGYLVITLASEIQIDGGVPQCAFNGFTTACALDATSTNITFTGPFANSNTQASTNSNITVQIINIRNPRSMKTSSLFTFYTFDGLGQLIDFFTGANAVVTMTQPAQFQTAAITNISSLVVSDSNVLYTFSVGVSIPIIPGDTLVISLPLSGQISMPSLSTCMSPDQPQLFCQATQFNGIMLIFNSSIGVGSLQTFVIGGFRNPQSGQITSPFQIGLYDNQNFGMALTDDISSNSFNLLTVQMKQPNLITQGATISVDTNVPTSKIVITIQFTLADNVPLGSKIVITYPSQLTPNQTLLSVTSTESTAQSAVNLVPSLIQIIGANFFSTMKSAGSAIQLVITGFQNPSKAIPTDAFMIDLFTPDGSVIDRLQQSSLFVQSKCDYPCKDCNPSLTGTSLCTACMTSDMSPLTLLEAGTCVSACATGYYLIGNQCLPCDQSCATCNTTSILCTSCPNTPKYQYLFNTQCVSSCSPGYFQNFVDSACDQCQAPCRTCDTSVNSCVECQADTYYLHGKCEQQCPTGTYISNPTNWTCDKCIDNCATCQVNTSTCKSCLPNFKLNTLNSSCFQGDCPVGISVEQSPGICTACSSQCQTCGNGNSSYCLTCPANLYLSPTNDCVVACNSNQAILAAGSDGITRCIDCQQGCSKCLDGKPNVCTSCNGGLVNFNFTECLQECPAGFKVNEASGNCLDLSIKCPYGYELSQTDQCSLAVSYCLPGFELNGYLDRCIPVPGLWIPFPVLITAFIVSIIVLCRAKGNKQTRKIQTLIIVLSFFEVPLYLLQAAFGAYIQHWSGMSLTLVGVFFHFAVNYHAARTILPWQMFRLLSESASSDSIQEETGDQPDPNEVDHVFKHWAGEHMSFLKRVRRFALLYNHKVIRCLNCGYMGMQKYMATFEHPDIRLHKPLLRVAVLNMVLTYLPIAIADVTVLKTVVIWGYQFTIFCIESLVLLIIISILEIIDYCQIRVSESGYFKISARQAMGHSRDLNVFAGADQGDGPSLDDKSSAFLLAPSAKSRLLHQLSNDRSVQLLKQLNDDLSFQKYYSGKFDNLGEYAPQHLNLTGSGQKWWCRSPVKAHPDSRNEGLGRSLSTQGHCKWNKKDFFDYQRECHSDGDDSGGDTYRPGGGEQFDHLRPWNSLVSESDYGDSQGLLEFREECARMIQEILDAPHTKTLDYKASFHILGMGENLDDDEDTDYEQLRGSRVGPGGEHLDEGAYVVQKPPKFNLNDVMGHFETDSRGNLIIVKREQHGNQVMLVDALGRRVNRRGYLVDEEGNVVSKFGDLVVAKENLDQETDDIPADLFRDLFIPQMPNRPRYKKRAQTGKHRAASSLMMQKKGGSALASSSSGEGAVGKSHKTITVGGKRHILSDGEDAKISIEEDDQIDGNSSNTGPNGAVIRRSDLFDDSSIYRTRQSRGNLEGRQYSSKGADVLGGAQIGIKSDRETNREDQGYQINIQMKPLFGKGKKRQSAERSPPIQQNQRRAAKKNANAKALPKKKQVAPSTSPPRVELNKPKQKVKMVVRVKSPQGGANDSKPIESGPPQSPIDVIIEDAMKPKIAKSRAVSVRNDHAGQPRKPKHIDLLDPTLYRIHLDVVETPNKNEKKKKGVEPEINIEEELLMPGGNINASSMIELESSDIGGYHQQQLRFPPADHHIDKSVMQSLDQPIFSAPTSKQYSALNFSGRMIMNREPSHERYGGSLIGSGSSGGVGDEMRGKFYQQHHAGSSIISPSIMQAAEIVNEGADRRHFQQSSISFNPDRHPSNERHHTKNNISSAYSQNLTLLMVNAKKAKKKETENLDPMAKLKKIFSRPPRQ